MIEITEVPSSSDYRSTDLSVRWNGVEVYRCADRLEAEFVAAWTVRANASAGAL